MQTTSVLADSILQYEAFVADDREVEALGLPTAATPHLVNLEYASDWLHLWLLSGNAIDATMNQASRYFQIVSFVFADASELFRTRQLRGLLPGTTTGGDRDAIASVRTTSYSVPASLTIQMYEYSSWQLLHRPAHQRHSLMELFVASPEAYRLDFT